MSYFDFRKNMVWIDSDGVIADFDKAATVLCGMRPAMFEEMYGTEEFWKRINSDPNFFLNLEFMPDAMELYNAVAHLPHAILTGMPKNMDASNNQKIDFFKKHFPPDLKVICTQASKKWTYCKEGDILIDDRLRYAKKWKKAGGTFIQHTSANLSIFQLKVLGVI